MVEEVINVDCGRRGGAGDNSKDAAALADLGDMLALAKHPNVSVEPSGAPSYSSQLVTTFTPISGRYSTPSVHSDASGAPISAACRASDRQRMTMFTEETALAQGT